MTTVIDIYTKEPWIKKVSLNMPRPSLKDNTADVDRLVRSLKKEIGTEEVSIPFPLLSQIPKKLRDYEYSCIAAVYKEKTHWKLIDLCPQDTDKSIYGLSVDLGTSTIVLRLLNISTGQLLTEKSFHNPQIEIGADILSRIHYASQPGGVETLQAMVLKRVNKEIARLAQASKIGTDQILALALAGNTTMTHLFLGLDPYWICREPYIPVVNKPECVSAQQLGLGIHPHGPVFVFPNVGSYFGGDLIAGILASGMNRLEEVCLLVDVGTNAEVVLGNKDWLMGCAGAAGPALEGGVASMGMMAGPGVIDKVKIDPISGEIHYSTIDDLPPIGICGSGLIDLVAQLYLAGMIDLRGKFVKERCGKRLMEVDGIMHFIVVPAKKSGTARPLTLSQPDIDSLIRSKAAMFTILTTITKTVDISVYNIGKFFIAGTFGSYIDPRSAITIGMIPDLPLDTYVPLGNTSLEGSTLILVSEEARQECLRIRDQITYLELNVNQEFMNLFSAAKFIPHTDRSLFPSVKPFIT
ncbi:MAG: DUF4445 domain-containing protein [Deltaproteobacteria bacterium]|nr:DUF4445 domain-containing protein [Deltaproteobacteria bacterium]MBW1930648.1 DUF4445 domain-containing protein [Deltaproteobacteria bacterium]MBW2023939.1 DUF4445 domain-containing protein [Deltaproteobacteria bacterium]MBW2124304.1 DUF4445 domain-containing protein [Deltaproteobacteria bacterium]